MAYIRTSARKGWQKNESLRNAHQQEFFESCCQRRLQEYTEQSISEKTPQIVAQARSVMAYLDQWCLSLASKRLLKNTDLCSIASLPQRDLLLHVPERPVWIVMDTPQPLYYADATTCTRSLRIAATFFYALECPLVLRHAFVPPVTLRPWGINDPLTPAWWEWQLELITTEGIVLNDYRFYYDARTAQWGKVQGSTCPWSQCQYVVADNLEEVSVLPCDRCQKAMNYYSSLLATILTHRIGQNLFLDTLVLETRKRWTFEHFLMCLKGICP